MWSQLWSTTKSSIKMPHLGRSGWQWGLRSRSFLILQWVKYLGDKQFQPLGVSVRFFLIGLTGSETYSGAGHHNTLAKSSAGIKWKEIACSVAAVSLLPGHGEVAALPYHICLVLKVLSPWSTIKHPFIKLALVGVFFFFFTTMKLAREADFFSVNKKAMWYN